MNNSVINSAWALSSYPAYYRFNTRMSQAESFQKARLFNLLKKNASCKFAVEHGFEKINSIKDFQKNIPIRTYDDYLPWLDKMFKGDQNILTTEQVLLFEPTGGSSGGTKLIPYTRSLKNEFRESINVWIYDLMKNFPMCLKGKSYWSVSPIITDKKFTEGGTPIGFEDDLDYLGVLGKFLQKVFVLPDTMNEIKSYENHRFFSALFLLQSSDLTLISIWNPSFLTLLLRYIEQEKEKLIRAMYDGFIHLPEPDASIKYPILKKNTRRSSEVEKILETGAANYCERIWPMLQVISCWTDGAAALHIDGLKNYFPNAFIQGKGLLATEGITSIPFLKATGSLPAFNSHFLEFLPESEDHPVLLKDLKSGLKYRVILTTGGGLYRYDSGDMVYVDSYYNSLPRLRFEGRNKTSDLYGEKVHELQAREILEKIKTEYCPDLKFIMMAPLKDKLNSYYVLYLESELSIKKEKEIGEVLENNLLKNFHYKHARKLGQLNNSRVFNIKQNGLLNFVERCENDGQKRGDIKHHPLDLRQDWNKYFDGKFSKP